MFKQHRVKTILLVSGNLLAIYIAKLPLSLITFLSLTFFISSLHNLKALFSKLNYYLGNKPRKRGLWLFYENLLCVRPLHIYLYVASYYYST